MCSMLSQEQKKVPTKGRFPTRVLRGDEGKDQGRGMRKCWMAEMLSVVAVSGGH